jgi:hypothetical protein
MYRLTAKTLGLPQKFKTLPTFYKTVRLITVLTTACSWTLSWDRQVQTTSSHSISLRSNLILSSHQTVSFLSKLSTHFWWLNRMLYAEVVSFYPKWFTFQYFHTFLCESYLINENVVPHERQSAAKQALSIIKFILKLYIAVGRNRKFAIILDRSYHSRTSNTVIFIAIIRLFLRRFHSRLCSQI